MTYKTFHKSYLVRSKSLPQDLATKNERRVLQSTETLRIHIDGEPVYGSPQELYEDVVRPMMIETALSYFDEMQGPLDTRPGPPWFTGCERAYLLPVTSSGGLRFLWRFEFCTINFMTHTSSASLHYPGHLFHRITTHSPEDRRKILQLALPETLIP